MRQYWNDGWYDAPSLEFEEWNQTAYTCRYASASGTLLWTYEAFDDEYAIYENSLVDYEDAEHGASTSGTPEIDWVFQMPPHRRELTFPQAILKHPRTRPLTPTQDVLPSRPRTRGLATVSPPVPALGRCASAGEQVPVPVLRIRQ